MFKLSNFQTFKLSKIEKVRSVDFGHQVVAAPMTGWGWGRGKEGGPNWDRPSMEPSGCANPSIIAGECRLIYIIVGGRLTHIIAGVSRLTSIIVGVCRLTWIIVGVCRLTYIIARGCHLTYLTVGNLFESDLRCWCWFEDVTNIYPCRSCSSAAKFKQL